MDIHKHTYACALFSSMLLLLLLLLFCIQYAYILSDPVIHVTVSLGRLPSEVWLLPQSWSQLSSLVCITTCAFAFVCISLFDVYHECVCVHVSVCVCLCVSLGMCASVFIPICFPGLFLCTCVCVCVYNTAFCVTDTDDCIKCLWWNIAHDNTVCHKMVHKSSMMRSNHLLIYSNRTS